MSGLLKRNFVFSMVVVFSLLGNVIMFLVWKEKLHDVNYILNNVSKQVSATAEVRPWQEGSIAQDTIWTVCDSGCSYVNPLEAWRKAIHTDIFNGSILTIKIEDGIYNLSDQFYTDTPHTNSIRIIGNQSDPSRVILNFIHTQGTNMGGIVAFNGGMLNMVDGVTIRAPTDGSGSLASTDSMGRHRWHDQSFGAGISAYGTGSSVRLGSHVVIHGFYYSLVADNNGGIDAPNGGVDMSLAGDVNAMARGGGVIVCTPCSARDASDYTHPDAPILGGNYDAERGGSLYIDGSSAAGSLIAGVTGVTGGHLWAHGMQLLGGLNGAGSGVWVSGNATGEFTASHIEGYKVGILAQVGGYAGVDGVVIKNCQTGMAADTGIISGVGAGVSGSSANAVQALHSGRIILFDTLRNLHGNINNISVEREGQDQQGSFWSASTVSIQ